MIIPQAEIMIDGVAGERRQTRLKRGPSVLWAKQSAK